MKILFYNHTGKVSGAERILLRIVDGLDLPFEPVVLCPAEGKLAEMIDGLSVRRIEINELDARFTWRINRLLKYFVSFARLFTAARATVKAEAPDLVHANSIRSGLLMSVSTLGLGIPIIWDVHDMLPSHPFSTAIRIVAAISQRTRIVAVSHAVADRFEGSFGRMLRGRVEVIHNAVDTERFSPDSDRRAKVRSQLGYREETLLGIVGQLTPRKGQLELIEAFAEIASELAHASLLIVGEAIFNSDSEYAGDLVDAANALGVADRVRFLGAREDIPDIMRALDLLIINSRVEPFGLTAIEAMAAGTPVLATSVDGLKEIIRHDEAGWLLPDLDRATLSAMLRSILTDREKLERVGPGGRRDVVARFATHRLMNEIHSLYRRVLATEGIPAPQRKKLTRELSAD